MANITIAGDLAPIGRNIPAFQSGPPRSLADLGLSPRDSLVIANLECPLADAGDAIVKGGPALRAPASAAKGIRSLGVSAVNLANNHIMDYGPAGLDQTIASLSSAGVRCFGAGRTSMDAALPAALEWGDAKLQVFGFAETEYNASTQRTAGASLLEISSLVRTLQRASKDSFVVALFHAGNEYFEYPSPWLRDTCRLAIELGAGVVVCQHSHCIGSYEVYNGGLIVYGQGNFIFDMKTSKPGWWLGLMVQLQIAGNTLRGFQFAPFRQTPGANLVEPLEPGPGHQVLDAFEQRSALLADEDKFLAAWDQFCEANRRNYQSHLFGLGRITRRVNRLLGFCDLIPRKGQRNIGNALRCQSHLEALRQLYSREKTC